MEAGHQLRLNGEPRHVKSLPMNCTATRMDDNAMFLIAENMTQSIAHLVAGQTSNTNTHSIE